MIAFFFLSSFFLFLGFLALATAIFLAFTKCWKPQYAQDFVIISCACFFIATGFACLSILSKYVLG